MGRKLNFGLMITFSNMPFDVSDFLPYSFDWQQLYAESLSSQLLELVTAESLMASITSLFVQSFTMWEKADEIYTHAYSAEFSICIM